MRRKHIKCARKHHCKSALTSFLMVVIEVFFYFLYMVLLEVFFVVFYFLYMVLIFCITVSLCRTCVRVVMEAKNKSEARPLLSRSSPPLRLRRCRSLLTEAADFGFARACEITRDEAAGGGTHAAYSDLCVRDRTNVALRPRFRPSRERGEGAGTGKTGCPTDFPT